MSRKFISVALFQTILLWQVSFGFFGLGNIFGLFGLGGASAMTPGTSGGEVVKQALSKLESSNIFPDSHDMMQRIAWVESKYGNHKNTYREGYNGGIWQVHQCDCFGWTFLTRKTVHHRSFVHTSYSKCSVSPHWLWMWSAEISRHRDTYTSFLMMDN